MLRRSFVMGAVLATLLPMAALAQGTALQAAFETLPDAGRRASQEQLQTGGFYGGAIDGRHGRGTHSALI